MTMWSGLGRRAIEAPTLIVTGDDDPLVPMSNALMMASRIPRARVFVGPGEGHFQLLDERSATLPAVREFLVAERSRRAGVAFRARVEHEHVDAQLREDGLGALPWGR